MSELVNRNITAQQDIRESSDEHITMYKMAWLFIIGCVIGFLLESVVCLVNKGYIESRRGVIYGPFNQVYGFGAVALVLALSPLMNKSIGKLFLGSAVVGGAFEFFCSWIQEHMFGTVSWNYTGEFLSIGGRTSLKFMFFWGILGVILIRFLYPKISRGIDRIPRKFGAFAMRGLAVFMAVNMLISLVAVGRWQERGRGVAAETQVEEALDELYPDERMKEVYPNMVIK